MREKGREVGDRARVQAGEKRICPKTVDIEGDKRAKWHEGAEEKNYRNGIIRPHIFSGVNDVP
jgi:hypothetical protein